MGRVAMSVRNRDIEILVSHHYLFCHQENTLLQKPTLHWFRGVAPSLGVSSRVAVKKSLVALEEDIKLFFPSLSRKGRREEVSKKEWHEVISRIVL